MGHVLRFCCELLPTKIPSVNETVSTVSLGQLLVFNLAALREQSCWRLFFLALFPAPPFWKTRIKTLDRFQLSTVDIFKNINRTKRDVWERGRHPSHPLGEKPWGRGCHSDTTSVLNLIKQSPTMCRSYSFPSVSCWCKLRSGLLNPEDRKGLMMDFDRFNTLFWLDSSRF